MKPNSRLASPEASGRRAWHLWASAALGMLFLTIALWVPVGIRTTGLAEEWQFLWLADRGIGLVPSSNWNPQHSLRPLVALPFALGYWLTPNSFVGMNLLLFALFVGKGLVLYALLRKLLPGRPLLAFPAAALFVVYPADAALVTLRTLNIHMALFCYLSAVFLLLAYQDRPRAALIPVMWLTIILSLGIYEVGYPLVLLTPLLLLLRRGGGDRTARLAALWYTPVLLLLLWTVVEASGQEGTYQAVAMGGEPLPMRLREALRALGWALRVIFVDSWRSAAAGLPTGGSDAFLAILAAAVGGWATWLHAGRGEAGSKRERPRLYGALLIGGLIALTAGLAPYLASPAHRFSSHRVFIYPALGSAVILMAAVGAGTRILARSRIPFVLVASLFLALGTRAVLRQQRQFAQFSLEQQRLLAEIVRQAPKLKRTDPLVLVFDRTETYRNSYVFGGNRLFRDALQIVYQNYALRAALCYPSNRGWSSVSESCGLEGEGVRITEGSDTFLCPYEQILAFAVEGVGQVKLLEAIPGSPEGSEYRPFALIDREAAPPPRARTLFDCWPIERCDPRPVAVSPAARAAASVSDRLVVPGRLGWEPRTFFRSDLNAIAAFAPGGPFYQARPMRRRIAWRTRQGNERTSAR